VRGLASWLAAAALLLPVAASADVTPAVVFLVRHAEKQTTGEDPALTEAGRQRAEALARVLTDAGVRAVYSTDFARTRDTAVPTATRVGAGIRIYDAAALEMLARDLKRPGARSLVVGHSNTTPELVGLLGGEPGPPIDEASEYDRLYVVMIGVDGAVSTVLLRYGL
jgi:phosphohistidine phosphatase SixA